MRDEASNPEISGGDSYAKQVPYNRQVPLWGGVGPAGFGLVMFHKHRKADQWEWSDAVSSGSLTQACKNVCMEF